MVQSILSRTLGIVGIKQVGRGDRTRTRRLQPALDGLESRNLLTGGSVALSSAGVVNVVPDATAGQNTVVVQYQNVGGATELDVRLNGVDNYFSPALVNTVSYDGSAASGSQSFINETGVNTVAIGGSGSNTFTGGSGIDVFEGGSGTNTFNAGTGDDILIGGSGPNVYNENPNGTGAIVEGSGGDTIGTSGGLYHVYVL